MTRRSKGTAGDNPHQLQIDWAGVRPASQTTALPPSVLSSGAESSGRAVPPLVQRLPWDFKTSFPQPTDEAIDNGMLEESDREPENLKSLHENYFAQCLATLKQRDAVIEARRRQIDPTTGSRPRSHAARERLRKYLSEEPGRLDHTFEILIGTYEEGFGSEASDAIRKAIIARHAGIDVVSEYPRKTPPNAEIVRKTKRVRASSTLPVPRPLRSSVNAATFGRDESGKPICPSADEVRAITDEQAERMIEMKEDQMQPALAKYAEDFGSKAGSQLEQYVRRQQRSR